MENSQILRKKAKEFVEMLLIARRKQRKLGLKRTRRRQRTKRQIRKKTDPRTVVVRKQIPKEPSQNNSAILEFDSPT